MTDAETTAEAELREWATGQKLSAKTVDLLVKEGFTSLAALALVDGDDLTHQKMRPTKTAAFIDMAVTTDSTRHGR